MRIERPCRLALGLALVLVCAAGARGEEDLFTEALAISKRLDPETDEAACRREFAALVAEIKANLAAANVADPAEPQHRPAVLAELNRRILIDRQVSYISNKYWRDSLFTAALLRKRGNCLSTALLYHFVARELKLPAGLALLPDHALICWPDAQAPLFVETTAKGQLIPRDALMLKYGLEEADLKPNGFLVPLAEPDLRAELRGNWSRILWTMTEREEALALLKKARAGRPDDPHLKLQEARYLLELGRVEEARPMLEGLLKAGGGSYAKAQAACAWADFLTTRGRIDEALEVLGANWEGAPNFLKLRMLDQLGELHRHKRDFEKAIRYHKLLTTLDPGAESYDELGSVLTEAHRDAEAIAAYEKALTYNPENFFTRVILAGLYERSGEREKGRAYFAKIEEPRDHKLTWHCALVWYYANIKEEEKNARGDEEVLRARRLGARVPVFRPRTRPGSVPRARAFRRTDESARAEGRRPVGAPRHSSARPAFSASAR
ncbi:MAG: tetratricopeptide repeat protein [Planctomycetota bacterium]|nr:tetratricopeptide repeat protein [Planctomycetota bacterium]